MNRNSGLGVIFDLDGTLLDTIGDIADAMNEVLKKYRHAGFPPEQYRNFVGEGARLMVTRALAAAKLNPGGVDRALKQYLVVYRTYCERSCCPYDGIPELLEELNRRALPIGILSNKPDEFTQRIVQGVFKNHSFKVVQGEKTELPRKPDPAAALRVAWGMHCKPGKVYFVGDSAVDMETAKHAGMVPVGVLWGFRDSRELLAAGARHLLQKPRDLLGLFEP